MPKWVIADESLPMLLGYWIGYESNVFPPWQTYFFVNDIYPDHTTVFADLVECTASGYSRGSLLPSNWTAPFMAGSRAYSSYGPPPFLWTLQPNTETIYGVALVTPSASKIIVSQRLAAPQPITAVGTLTFAPQLTFTTDTLPP